MSSRDQFTRLFVPVSLAEGVSFLILLGVAVPLQVVGHHQMPVQIFGMLHGLLFIAYVMIAAYGYTKRKWTAKRLVWILVMSVLPTGAFFAERSVLKETAAVDAAEPVGVPTGSAV
jgi:integral membrane protein